MWWWRATAWHPGVRAPPLWCCAAARHARAAWPRRPGLSPTRCRLRRRLLLLGAAVGACGCGAFVCGGVPCACGRSPVLCAGSICRTRRAAFALLRVRPSRTRACALQCLFGFVNMHRIRQACPVKWQRTYASLSGSWRKLVDKVKRYCPVAMRKRGCCACVYVRIRVCGTHRTTTTRACQRSGARSTPHLYSVTIYTYGFQSLCALHGWL